MNKFFTDQSDEFQLNELLACHNDFICLIFQSFILQGQMLYLPEEDLMLFLCYPSVVNLDDLTR